MDQTPNEYRDKIRTDGYFLQASADMYDQFYLTAGVRYDGSNTFGEENKRYAYPKFSGAWDLSSRVADATEGLFSFAKVRAAYGVAGKQPDIYSNVNAYQTATITDGWLSPNGLYTIYGGNEGVVSEGTLGNANIKPERTTEYELGGDVAFFDNKLSLGLTYYSARRQPTPSCRSTYRPAPGSRPNLRTRLSSKTAGGSSRRHWRSSTSRTSSGPSKVSGA